VDQTRRPTAGAATHVAFIDKQNSQATHGCVSRDPGAVDSGADDDNVELSVVGHQWY
jgi:hypothetical protein